MPANLRVCIVVLGVLASAELNRTIADTITIDGIVYDNVYITSSATMYYVRIPGDVIPKSVPKNRVHATDVVISEDEDERKRLLEAWRTNKEKHDTEVARLEEEHRQKRDEELKAEHDRRVAEEAALAREKVQREWKQEVDNWARLSEYERVAVRAEVESRRLSLEREIARAEAYRQIIVEGSIVLREAAVLRDDLVREFSGAGFDSLVRDGVNEINRQGRDAERTLQSHTREYYALAGKINQQYPIYEADARRIAALDAELKKRPGYVPSDGPDLSRAIAGESREGSGSGFVVAGGGYIMTCAHVVAGASTIEVVSSSGKKYQAKIVAADDENDWALLFVSGLSAKPIPVAPPNSLKTGATIFNLGFPMGSLLENPTPVAGRGDLASLQGMKGDSRHIQVTVPLNPGSSGSPILDKHGRWIALASHKLNDVLALLASGAIPQGINFAVKASFIEPLARSKVAFEKDQTDSQSELTLEEIVERVSDSVVLLHTR